MAVLLIQFSDIHLSSNNDPILQRIPSIKNALRDKLDYSDDILIIVPGDIANSGNQREYDLAQNFFYDFVKEIKTLKQNIKIHYFIVPGNHDCDLKDYLHEDTRELAIKNVLKNPELLQKPGIIYDCLGPQQSYFKLTCPPKTIPDIIS